LHFAGRKLRHRVKKEREISKERMFRKWTKVPIIKQQQKRLPPPDDVCGFLRMCEMLRTARDGIDFE